jgi:hypothetical protein
MVMDNNNHVKRGRTVCLGTFHSLYQDGIESL